MKVWKFKVVEGSFLVLPKGSKILSTGIQGSDIFIWALVYPNAPFVERRVIICPTGSALSPAEQNYDFIGTVLLAGGVLVYHVFAEKEVS